MIEIVLLTLKYKYKKKSNIKLTTANMNMYGGWVCDAQKEFKQKYAIKHDVRYWCPG